MTVGGSDAGERFILYVPTQPHRGNTAGALELRRSADGLMVLPAYSSRAMLVRCCGGAQPWVTLDSDGLEEVRRRFGVEIILWDGYMPEGQRRDVAEPLYEEDNEVAYPMSTWMERPIGNYRPGQRK